MTINYIFEKRGGISMHDLSLKTISLNFKKIKEKPYAIIKS